MGEKFPLLSAREIVSALHKVGFVEVSQSGSHKKLKNSSDPPRTVIIPMHDEVARGTLRSILQQADIDLEVFLNLF